MVDIRQGKELDATSPHHQAETAHQLDAVNAGVHAFSWGANRGCGARTSKLPALQERSRFRAVGAIYQPLKCQQTRTKRGDRESLRSRLASRPPSQNVSSSRVVTHTRQFVPNLGDAPAIAAHPACLPRTKTAAAMRALVGLRRATVQRGDQPENYCDAIKEFPRARF